MRVTAAEFTEWRGYWRFKAECERRAIEEARRLNE
jgi:hypothetical protein